MQRFGFVRSELEIKTLILYVLRRIAMPVRFEELTEMTMCDGALDYFEFAGCLEDLVKTGHIEHNGDNYSITEKGIGNLEICESSLALSVRQNADKSADRLAFRLRREQQVLTEINELSEGEYELVCRLRDDTGEILSFTMKMPSREQAKKLEAGFKRKAESIYNILLNSMLKPDED
jgi:hypothetical protein